jgi:hypothetical protein
MYVHGWLAGKRVDGAGLPDGLFYYQKSQFGYILEGLGMENGIFYCHLV